MYIIILYRTRKIDIILNIVYVGTYNVCVYQEYQKIFFLQRGVDGILYYTSIAVRNTFASYYNIFCARVKKI